MMPVIFNDCVGFGKPRDITPPLAKGWHSYDIGHHGGHKSNPFTGEKNLKGWIYWDESEWRPVMEEYLSALLSRFRNHSSIIAWDYGTNPATATVTI